MADKPAFSIKSVSQNRLFVAELYGLQFSALGSGESFTIQQQ